MHTGPQSLLSPTGVVAFVPVRGGSSMRGKNVRLLGGKPLVAWCLEALQRAASVPRVVVATDCDLIEGVVRGLGLAKVEIYRRSAASATDTAPTEAVVLEWLDREPLADDTTFVLVQATSPLVTAADFDTALRTFWLSGADSLLSCVRTKRFFWRPDGTPVNYDPARRPRRQDWDGWLMENGAFYVSRAGAIRQSQNRLSGRVAVHEMAPHTQVELDDEDDWAMAEALVARHAQRSVHEPDADAIAAAGR